MFTPITCQHFYIKKKLACITVWSQCFQRIHLIYRLKAFFICGIANQPSIIIFKIFLRQCTAWPTDVPASFLNLLWNSQVLTCKISFGSSDQLLYQFLVFNIQLYLVLLFCKRFEKYSQFYLQGASSSLALSKSNIFLLIESLLNSLLKILFYIYNIEIISISHYCI